LFSNFTQGGGLNGIWHGLDEHCSSNIQCGPGACCMKPTILGLKRAITDGSNVRKHLIFTKLTIILVTAPNYARQEILAQSMITINTITVSKPK